MTNLNFEHLSPTEFENFCYDLISEMTFRNVDWRKGTPKHASSADKGRDIQAELHREDIDKKHVVEQWFFDCKHYSKGVPPTALQDSLAWATAHRPHKLVFISSGFFSNPCKEFVEQYTEQNRPSFEIRLWELKDLEKFCSGAKTLLAKYGIGSVLEARALMNPVHWETAKSNFHADIPSLIQVLDSVDGESRDKAFEMTYHMVISPRMRQPLHPREKIGDLILDEVGYGSFKKIITQQSFSRLDDFLAESILRHALAYTFHMGNVAEIDMVRSRHEKMIERIHNDESLSSEKKKRYLAMPEKMLSTLDSRTAEYQQLYNWLCEKVVRPVMNASELKVLTSSALVKRQLDKKFKDDIE